jgi:hypothetical protein
MLKRASAVAFAISTLSPFLAVARQSPDASSAAPLRAEVLVLGVYHMANPGRDVFNTEADDVLAPGRQAEIAQLIEVLKRFRPTKIAVEADFWKDRVAKAYGRYLAGEHELSRNETQQIGFRLARDLGHETVYPADVDGEFPIQRLADYAKTHGLSEEYDALMAEFGETVEERNEYLASHTVLETLLRMNSEDSVTTDMGFSYRLARFGEQWNWAGPDLATAWFRRNIRIYSNIVQLADSPNERVLAIFGAGHLGWLRHNIASDPNLRLRKLAEFVE